MDLRHVESILKDSENGGLVKKKEALVSKLDDRNEVDFGTALQLFLDHISVDSIVGIRNSQVLELNSDDCLQDAIRLLYEKNVSGALIAGVLESDSTGRYSDRYVGFVQFASMVLWSLEVIHSHDLVLISDHRLPDLCQRRREY
ncbi:PREDICTED: uncharacterized protein LOC109114577 [Nelumbo nucifera]|uniref:Uncharacterized protein LOC109114577 n=1 Tax=Nelumbo nucifera TaxID=4432 RepID=A0A1U8Q2G7_NELNU|nr:PREDICTED: uncharacterized protein LOC109114577 [Nelumbo nucifera]